MGWTQLTKTDFGANGGFDDRFYRIRTDGDWVDVWYGVVGQNGMMVSRRFATAAKRRAFMKEKIAGAEEKGYAPSEDTNESPAPETLRRARERGSGTARADEALLRGARKGSPDQIAKALEQGANPDASGKYDGPAIVHAAFQVALGRPLAALEHFVSAGADVDAADPQGRTALHMAIRRYPSGLLITPKKAKRAAGGSSEAAARLLLKHSASSAIADEDGETALHYWADSGEPAAELLQALIDAGGSLEARDSDGRTPLHHAYESGNADRESRVALLLEHGADPKARDQRGKVPEQYAESGAISAMHRASLEAIPQKLAAAIEGFQIDDE